MVRHRRAGLAIYVDSGANRAASTGDGTPYYVACLRLLRLLLIQQIGWRYGRPHLAQ